MSHDQHRSFGISRTSLIGAAAAVITVGALAACSSAAPAGGTNPPAPDPKTSKADTRTSEPSKSGSRTEEPKTHTTTGSEVPGNGFDGPAFQQAMSAAGVAPTGSTSGKGTTALGVMYYKFSMNSGSVAAINCTVQAEAGDAQQSDQDAQNLGSTFLTACADYNFSTDATLKDQANSFVTSHLAGLQGEQPPVNQAIGPVLLSLGKAAPGFYFLNMRH